jgi:hypothetical protein
MRRPKAKPTWAVSKPDKHGWATVEGVHATRGAGERLRVRVVDGEVRELHLLDNGEPITGTRLRSLQLATIALMVETLGNLAEKPKPARLKSRPERGYGEEHYASVAEIYKRAIAEGRPPIAAVAAEVGVPRSTAARWVKVARHNYDFLKRTSRGKKRA